MQLRRIDEANAVQRAVRRLVASRPGAWVSKRLLHRLDLRGHPDAVLEVDGVTWPVRAEQVHGAERERVRQAALAYYAGYTAYEQRAGGRDLGFFILRPTPRTTQRPSPGPEHDCAVCRRAGSAAY